MKLASALTSMVEEDPSLTVDAPPGYRRDGARRAGRDASARRGRSGSPGGSAEARDEAPRVVPYRETIRAGDEARPPQEAERRSRPVRRRGARGEAAAARRGLHLRRQDHRRRGAAQLHPGGGGGRARRAQARAARGFPVVDCRRDADRRLLPHGRFLRPGVQDGRHARHARGAAGGAAGAAGADPSCGHRVPNEATAK